MNQQQIQALVDGMNAQRQKDRSGQQMTLGLLIVTLEGLPPGSAIVGLGHLISYRGYYCDLAFEPDETPREVTDVLAECRAAMGRVFQGYKGGDFQMGEMTPLWVAPYGSGSGDRLMGLNMEQSPVIPILAPEPNE